MKRFLIREGGRLVAIALTCLVTEVIRDRIKESRRLKVKEEYNRDRRHFGDGRTIPSTSDGMGY